MPSNAVSATIAHCTRAQAKGHPQYGQVATIAVWATQAGYPGNKASSVRAQAARNSGNGCGRTNRYGSFTAAGLVAQLQAGAAHNKAVVAGNSKQATALANKQAKALAQAKARANKAAVAGGTQAKAKARRTAAVASATAPPVLLPLPSTLPQPTPSAQA